MMNYLKKPELYFLFVINLCVLGKKPSVDFDKMNEQAQKVLACKVCTENTQECVAQMQKRCDLARDIYSNAKAVLGKNYLSVKELLHMMNQCERTIISIKSNSDQNIIKKMMHESTKKDEGIADALLLKAIDVSEQTKKWIERS